MWKTSYYPLVLLLLFVFVVLSASASSSSCPSSMYTYGTPGGDPGFLFFLLPVSVAVAVRRWQWRWVFTSPFSDRSTSPFVGRVSLGPRTHTRVYRKCCRLSYISTGRIPRYVPYVPYTIRYYIYIFLLCCVSPPPSSPFPCSFFLDYLPGTEQLAFYFYSVD